MSKAYDIAIVGATGLVGETLIQVLEERGFPAGKVYALAHERTLGGTVKFRGAALPLCALEDFDFESTQIAFFAAGASVAAQFAPKAANLGNVVIDSSSHFRYDEEIPLVVPEVNAARIADYTSRGIIANPGCATIPLVVALKPIHDAVGVERVNVATYQSVSSGGRGAVDTLTEHTRQVLAGLDPMMRGKGKWVAFNAVPHIEEFMDGGFTREEMKIIWETRKIMESPQIMVNPTAVRVPVFFGHSEAVHIETRTKVTVAEVRKLLNSAPGVVLLDGRELGAYPTAATDAAGRDSVFVGRIREDPSHARGVDLWIVADNVRKGAATNSVQIAEILVNQFM
jgi:aspartate-semialdehyde dehydrogenase